MLLSLSLEGIICLKDHQILSVMTHETHSCVDPQSVDPPRFVYNVRIITPKIPYLLRRADCSYRCITLGVSRHFWPSADSKLQTELIIQIS